MKIKDRISLEENGWPKRFEWFLILNIISKCYNTYNISWLNDNGAV